MKEQGLRPDDPEFIKVRNLLTAVNQQYHFTHQRDLHTPLHQRHLLQQNQASVVNGAHSHPGTILTLFAIDTITLMYLT